MKQHLLGDQLKEISYEERITLLALVSGLEKSYVQNEYEKAKKNEVGMLRAYGYQVNVGELIGLIESYTRQFPSPIISHGKYAVNISFTKQDDVIELNSGYQLSYCDALYEIVKNLLNGKYIYMNLSS